MVTTAALDALLPLEMGVGSQLHDNAGEQDLSKHVRGAQDKAPRGKL